MSYNLGRDELFWRIGNEKSEKLLEDVKQLKAVNFSDDNGRSYLHVACSAHNLEVIRLLLEKGADPNCKDAKGRLPIMSAIGRKNKANPQILRVFLDYGLDLTALVHGVSLKETIESFEDEELNNIIAKSQI